MTQVRQLLNGLGGSDFPPGGYARREFDTPGSYVTASVPVKQSGMTDKQKLLLVGSLLTIAAVFAVRGTLAKTIAQAPGLSGTEGLSGTKKGRKKSTKKTTL